MFQRKNILLIVWVSFQYTQNIDYCNPMESPSVISNSLQSHGIVHGILQARILEWVAVPFSRGSSQLRDQTQQILHQLSHKGSPVFLGFPCGPAGKESAFNEGDLGLIPGFGRSPGEGKGHPLQYSGLENSMEYTVHGVAKSGKEKWFQMGGRDLSVIIEIF